MAREPIPAVLAESASIEIDGAVVARSLGLDVEAFRQLMADRKITVLCERGTDEDAELYRASFYYGDRSVRLIVDKEGRVVRS